MVDSVFLAELSWPEFESRCKARIPVFLPVGATEQHGPHLPLGVDVVLPVAVCARVARAIGGVVAPPIAYGYKSQTRSGGGEGFPGTTSLEAHTLTLLVRDGVTDLVVLRLSYWDFLRPETLERIFPHGYPGIDLEHASFLETSLMLALRPDLVDMAQIPTDGPASFPAYDRMPGHAGHLPASGVLADAKDASAEKGQWLLDDHATLITEAVRREFGL
jgi:creatinine amidohydrolase